MLTEHYIDYVERMFLDGAISLPQVPKLNTSVFFEDEFLRDARIVFGQGSTGEEYILAWEL